MKIAVTYEGGLIFQHFGHTSHFKIYEIEQDKVVSAQVVDAAGFGHGALAGFLKQQGVQVLICGGIGGGAQMALAEAGIQLFGGVSGDADEAVAALLAGQFGVFCRENGLFPGQMAEEINEIFLELVGDILVEADGSQFRLIEEYREDAAAWSKT